MDISLPPLKEQKAIAEVLSSLDDKINLLHRQNRTLENLAQTLFRQWFIEEAKDEWEEATLFNVINLIGGGTPKTSIYNYWNGNINWLSCGCKHPQKLDNLNRNNSDKINQEKICEKVNSQRNRSLRY